MQGKLSQRIILQYYKTKLKTLNKLSPHLAAKSAFDLFCTPGPVKKMEMPPIFHKAESVELMYEGNAVRGYYWKTSLPAKRVLICHGFQSRAYKFEQYVRMLITAGFEVLAFDAPAHGLSDGKRINAFTYSRIILEIEQKFGPLYAFICHSFGGLAGSFALEEMVNANKKLVLIAPASETRSAIKNFADLFSLSNEVQSALHELIFEIRQHDVSWYSINRAIKNLASDILWIHDTDDKQCPYKDTEASRNGDIKNLTFITTEHLGHNKIYRDAAVQQAVIKFLLK